MKRQFIRIPSLFEEQRDTQQAPMHETRSPVNRPGDAVPVGEVLPPPGDPRAEPELLSRGKARSGSLSPSSFGAQAAQNGVAPVVKSKSARQYLRRLSVTLVVVVIILSLARPIAHLFGLSSGSISLFLGSIQTGTSPLRQSRLPPIKTVFVIVMENKDWSSIYESRSAPYINRTLLPMASYATQYYTPPYNRPSLPNYLWLEAGTNFGITKDLNPSQSHQRTPKHLVTLLENAGYSWKAYLEGISGTDCPLQNSGLYAVRHNPMVYFDDVTGTNNPHSPYCIAHERPYQELITDLNRNTVANYNYIVPNACDDMHNKTGCQSSDPIKNGDSWLSVTVPLILHSQAYQRGGLLLITWDEGTHEDRVLQWLSMKGGKEAPIGLIALSPYVKGHGYSNAISYTHSSILLTLEEIFGLTPLLGDAAHAADLGDLFRPVVNDVKSGSYTHWILVAKSKGD